MFEVKDQEKIGKYLNDMIKKKYGTASDFCRAYLKLSSSENDENAFTNLKNRISAIVRGKKEVQLYDLPVFTMLLDVSCEEILSAGAVHSYNENHITNYILATSHDERIWQSYINNEAEFILNPDEYDKTIIDYAFEYGNYELLQYLVKKNYIWFVPQDPQKIAALGFAAAHRSSEDLWETLKYWKHN